MAAEAAGGAVSSEQPPLISMGPQPPCLKIAPGALLKMLTLQLTFGRSWQAIKPELKIRAAGAGGGGGAVAPGNGDRGWLGPRATGLGQPLLVKAVFSDRPSVGGHWALCWKDAAEEEDAEGKGGGGRMDMESPRCLGSPPNSRALSIIKPVGGGGIHRMKSYGTR